MKNSEQADSTIAGLSPRGLLAGGLGEFSADDARGELAGEQVGAYLLVDLIGEGGMGEVYLAEQSEPVQREVAFKLIKRGMESASLVQRFEMERQTLASLEHPNIARVLDAGTIDDGRPYFVMELVEGVPIGLYCEREQLETPARLKLIEQACRGLEHAHRRGVIHRDLKSSNLLVSGGEQLELKIIDFGLAKVLRSGSSGAQTMVGQVLGTPSYMSPEQAAGGSEVDTRTDFYGLGAVLYELLTGTPPFAPDRFEAVGPVEVARILAEEEPVSPVARGLSAGVECRDELEWIVLKALEKEPERRYGSAAELAEDLGRYQEHQPVRAGPPGALYRAKKFCRRHRTACVAAVLVGLAAGVGIWKTMEAAMFKEERNMALEQTMQEGHKTGVVIMFVNEVLTAMDVEDPEQRREAMLEALDFFERELLPGPAHDPHAAFLGYQMLGIAYKSLREWERAEQMLERAHELATGMPMPEEDLILVQSVKRALAEVYQVQERHEEACRLLEELDMLFTDKFGPFYNERALGLQLLVHSMREIGRGREAEMVEKELRRVEAHFEQNR